MNSEATQRAKKRFLRKPRPMGFPKTIEPAPQEISIEWQCEPVSKKTEREVSDLVMIPGEWGFLTDKQVDEIANKIKRHDINLDQGLSLRRALMQERAVYGHGRMMSRAHTFRRRYDNGASVIDLSKQFDFPPVAIFRAILTSRGWSKARIKEALRNPNRRLSKRDAEQFLLAEDKDRVTNVDQGETHQIAETFEDIIADHFEALGVRFRRQDELLEEQVATHGRPVNTPDILFLDHVEINGVPIAWIDAKHFYGSSLSFPRKKTRKQVKRYIEEWGTGAIVYRHGFCDGGTKIHDALLLDSSPLDVSRLKPDA